VPVLKLLRIGPPCGMGAEAVTGGAAGAGRNKQGVPTLSVPLTKPYSPFFPALPRKKQQKTRR